MNKRKAKTFVETETLTFGMLKEAVQSKRVSGGQSSVNPQFPMEAVLDIYDAAIKERDDSEVLKPFRYDVYRRRDVTSGDALTARNIVRDCM